MTSDPETWLQCFVPNPEPSLTLICFPHAGGSASFFRDWGNHLLDIEVHAVCYPGRAQRIDEPPPRDLLRLAREIADALEPLWSRPLALFGHSMGAVVALESARALEARGVRVSHLFASGSRKAPYPVSDPGDFREEDIDAVSQLVGLGGTDPELAADPAFQELVLPYVLSDGRMFHAYRPQRGPALRCPVTAIVGDADTDSDLRPWDELTDGAFREYVVPGDHFYLRANPPYALLQALFERQEQPVSLEDHQRRSDIGRGSGSVSHRRGLGL